ncbi:MAG: hypothetical protein EZS28_047963, partial [Streblomastix strix]
ALWDLSYLHTTKRLVLKRRFSLVKLESNSNVICLSCSYNGNYIAVLFNSGECQSINTQLLDRFDKPEFVSLSSFGRNAIVRIDPYQDYFNGRNKVSLEQPQGVVFIKTGDTANC